MQQHLNSDVRSAGRANPALQPFIPQQEGTRRGPIQGHIRHPILAREPSPLESIRSITDTFRTLPSVFSPASKNAPGTSPPIAAHRSTAMSYGRFVGSTSPAPLTHTYGPRSPYLAPEGHPSNASPGQAGFMTPDLPPELENEFITWASWDEAQTSNGKRQLLLLGYAAGLQIWDVTSIDELHEVLNASLTSFIATEGVWIVHQALVLPAPSKGNDDYSESRPLLAIVARDISQYAEEGPTEVLIYSLRTHTVVRRVGTPQLNDPNFGASPSSSDGSDPGEDYCNVVEMAANAHYVVISTHSPPAIHILSAPTLQTVYAIPQQALAPSRSTTTPVPSPSHPIFALSARFLAFASPPPLPHQRSRTPGLGPSSAASSVSGFSPTLGAIGAGGMELVGSGAKKVGEGVLMGMRALSGLAFGGNPTPPSPSPPYLDYRSAPFSKSAPNAGISPARSPPVVMTPLSPPVASLTPGQRGKRTSFGGVSGESVLNPPVESGYVTILDLAPLRSAPLSGLKVSTTKPHPIQIAHFLATSTSPSVIPSTSSHHIPIQTISFSPSGTQLCVCDVNGHIARVFQIRGGLRGLRSSKSWATSQENAEPPSTNRSRSSGDRLSSHHRRRSSGASSASSSAAANRFNAQEQDTVWHMYDLVRGTTNAKVCSIYWAEDSRWIGIGTARGTLHIFPINPYGGKPDEVSHLDGKVRNPPTLQPWPATVHPITRLKESSKDQAPAPVYTFLPPAMSKSSALLGPSIDRPSSRSKSSNPSSIRPTLSYAYLGKTGFQDVLAFSASTGLLTLRRCSISPVMSPNDHGARGRRGPNAASADFGRSLPASGVSLMMSFVGSPSDDATLKASETLVATWDLKRDRTWDEVKTSISTEKDKRALVRRGSTIADTLSQAELSTFSTSAQVVTPSLYLSHQFNFFSLQDDWHALLRRAQMDVPTEKIEVRKDVEVIPQGHSSSFGSAGGPRSLSRMEESFVQDDAGHAISSSIERPMASALSTNIDPQSIPTVMPSFPNAYKPSSWRDPISPVRSVAVGVADGVQDGIGRIKREIHKARAPGRKASNENPEVPSLAFDDEDAADFAQDGAVDNTNATLGVGAGVSPSAASGSAPSTTQVDEPTSEDTWSEKEDEMTKVLAEEAAFDEIGVAGFIMEEEEERQKMQFEAATPKIAKGSKKKGKKK